MEVFDNILLGLQTAATATNLLYCLVGVFLGTAVGVLPGLGPTATMSILLPITFGLPATPALIMLAGIYYGAQYGGSTTAILVNLPGEASSIVTAIDGNKMAQQGRAGKALATAALASFFAGTFATFVVAFFAPPLAQVGLAFGPTEYFSLMVLGLVASVTLASGSLLHAFAAILLGLLLGTIGTDVNTGIPRFSLGIPELIDGIDFVTVAMGVFAIGEILSNLDGTSRTALVRSRIEKMMPTLGEMKQISGPILRGTAMGSVLGFLPGGGALMASFAAYALEKRVSANHREFGHGAIEGVAAPEAANNAGSQTSFIPMLTLAIPATPGMALMIGAMVIQGIQPGPTVMTQQPSLFWGLIASMWIGNVMLVILNLPLIGIWVRMISIPYRYLYPMILAFCVIGAFSLTNTNFEIFIMAIFGVVGYLMKKLGAEPAPLLLAFILGPMMEEFLRRAMLVSRGDPSVFLTRPISLVLLLIALVLLTSILLPTLRRTREVAFQDTD